MMKFGQLTTTDQCFRVNWLLRKWSLQTLTNFQPNRPRELLAQTPPNRDKTKPLSLFLVPTKGNPRGGSLISNNKLRQKPSFLGCKYIWLGSC
jgi:hypothetical protein